MTGYGSTMTESNEVEIETTGDVTVNAGDPQPVENVTPEEDDKDDDQE